jgi:DNA repair exonuclease SbcCD ATPase subunit
LQFRRLVLNNFMSYKELDENNFDHPELVLIEGRNLDVGGSNGAGKSSIWDGISFALFGSTVRGLKGDEVISHWAKGDCCAEVEFVFKGETYIVARYRKHSEYGDRLIVNHTAGTSKKVVELGTLAQTQEWIENTFKIDFDLFRCTVLFAQGETFNFIDSGNKTQKEILSKVMRINYDEFLSRAKDGLRDVQDRQSEIDRKMIVLNSHLKDDEELGFESEIAEWDEKQKIEIKSRKTEIAQLEEKLNKLSAELGSVEKFEAVKLKIDAQISSVQKERDTVKETIGGLQYKMKSMVEEMVRLKKLKAECPTCLQEIDGDRIEKLLKERSKTVNIVSKECEAFEDKEVELRGKLKDFREKLDKVNAVISEAREKARTAKMVKCALDGVKEELESVKAQDNPFIKKQEEEKRKQEEIRSKIAKFKKEEKQLLAEIPYRDFWVKAFGDAGIKSFVFDLICSSLTNKTNKFLNLLTKGTVTISFDTQKKLKSGELREKFDVSIVKDGKETMYAAYSGGEKRRISLATDMALSEIMSDFYGSKFSMVCFDEQASYLDTNGRESFMDLLKDLARSKRVFVVDHDAEFKSRFDEVWVAEKKDGVSRLIA